MIATGNLYWNSDRSRVVKEGDPAAAFLLAVKGSEIPKEHEGKISPAAEVESSPVKVETKESALPTRRRR